MPVVDNLLSEKHLSADNLCMAHFGEFIRGLRTDRQMTQQQLASNAGVSVGTIAGAERAEHCTMNPSTQRLLLLALNASMPLSGYDRGRFAELTGTQPDRISRIIWQSEQEASRPREPSNIEVIGPGPRPTVALPGDTPDGGMRLASALALALRRGSAAELAAVIEAWAAIRPERPAEGLDGAVKIEIGIVGEGDAARDVSIYAPTNPPKESSQQSTARARKKQA